MTDGGDGEYEVHPGDPWSPGWSDDAAGPTEPRPETPELPEKKRDKKQGRRWFGRKPRRETPEAVEWPTEEHVAYSEPAVHPEARFTPATTFEPEVPAAVPPPQAAPAPPPPMPAWLSDPPRPERNPPVPVELPAWIGEATAGAEVVTASFGDTAPPAPGPVNPAGAEPATGDAPEPAAEIEVAADAADTDEAADPAAVSRAAFEALRRLDESDAQPATEAMEDPFDALRRLEAATAEPATVFPAAADEPAPPVEAPTVEQPAITGRYGVAGREAFAALGEADGGDLADWEAFAGATGDSRPPGGAAGVEPADTEVEASDRDAAEPAPTRRRGIWPFRRRVEPEAVVEESADWFDDGTAPAPGWFADIDEDEVIPPTADLPETEWPPAPAPSATETIGATSPAPFPVPPETPAQEAASVGPSFAAADTGEQPPLDFSAGAAPLVEVPPTRMPDPEVFPPLRVVPRFESVAPLATPPPAAEVAGDLPAAEIPRDEPADAIAGLPSPVLPPWGAVGAEEATVGDVAEPQEELPDDDLEDLRSGGPWSLAFDDGTADAPYGLTAYDPTPAPAVRGDRDVWEDAEDWDPEATVEMTDPGLTLSEDLYGGARTIEHRGLAEEIFRLGEEDTEWQAMAAAMPGVETGVVGFEDVADLSTGERYQEAPRSDLAARVGTGALLLVFLLGTMFVGGAAMAVFIGAMALLGIWEFYGTLRRLEFQPLGLLGYVGGLGLLAAVWFHGPVAVPIALSLLVVLVFFVYAFSPLRQDALANGGLTVLGVAWVAGTVAFATPILRQEEFRILVMALVAATVAMDVGAFSFGRTWGSRALAPVVSPNKSVEGLLGGIVVTMGAGLAFGLLAEPFDLTSGLALGAVVSVMAPLGDLAESMVKRSLGVKDMGTILPGHGGVLDRIDGFLFVLPAAWLLYLVSGLLG